MKSLSQLQVDFKKARVEIEQLINQEVPRIIGNVAVKVVKENFILQAYDDGITITTWPERKASTNKQYDAGHTINAKTGRLSKYRTGKNSTYKGSVYSSTKPLLRQSLALFNSIAYQVRGRQVFIGTNLNIVPYALAHNEGKHNEPRRQFMPVGIGNGNPKIMKSVINKVNFEIEKRMRLFKK